MVFDSNHISPSTQPPPSVPTVEPSLRINNLDPIFWGVEPFVFTTVAITIILPCSNSFNDFSITSFIIKNIFLIIIPTNYSKIV